MYRLKQFNGKGQQNKKDLSTLVHRLTDEEKTNILQHAYIGKKGYTISKNVLSKEEETFLKKELTVKPELNGQFIVGLDAAFPVYRENHQKIYLPRFYGIERYGFPTGEQPCRLDLGDNIFSVDFNKPLRDYQNIIVEKYVNYVHGRPNGCGGAILQVYAGSGKTVMSLKIIAMLKKKTIILVHKEFLMNQWIERIQEFLPTASIGKIQGPIIDIAGKDIVIGMIQSIYDREYDDSVFSSFGLTIIDEVHRIGSEQFSKTLLRVVTPYMLGISATVERKDKLTKILYMFIGERIHNEERTKEDVVSVRSIRFMTNIESFNETEYDMRGNPQYSKMIVKLCDFSPRTEFILRVLKDLREENSESQIMVLGHNRSILKYIHDAIEHRGFATAGYYLGGMKETELKESETKNIVVATYAMAAEALDIKTLSTLVMVTPKTDVIQSVGRILRMKHENPIIVDIVDSHDIFQNQWKQRLRYYKKCNYRIRQTTSSQYKNMMIDWMKDNTWKRLYDPVLKLTTVSTNENVNIKNQKTTEMYEDFILKQRNASYNVNTNTSTTKIDVNRFFHFQARDEETLGKCMINFAELQDTSNNDFV